MTFATDVAAEVTTFAFRAGGSSALYETSKLQRLFRDAHAAARHIAASCCDVEHYRRTSPFSIDCSSCRTALFNIVGASAFSSDATIQADAHELWHLRRLQWLWAAPKKLHGTTEERSYASRPLFGSRQTRPPLREAMSATDAG